MLKRKQRLPTDLAIIRAIYAGYVKDYRAHDREGALYRTYIPIDIDSIADDLQYESYELFGRLYYVLDNKFRYKQDNGSMVHFFAIAAGDQRHCINFPYLAAVKADMEDIDRRNGLSLLISGLSLLVSLAALLLPSLGR